MALDVDCEGITRGVAALGGLMYLARSISWRGATCRMAGVVPADVVMHDAAQGRGLVALEPTHDHPWLGDRSIAACANRRIRAHEFHYAGLTNIAPRTRFAWKVVRGFGVDGRNDGIIVGNVLASFSHLRDTSACHWAERFVGFTRQTRARRSASAPRSAALPLRGAF